MGEILYYRGKDLSDAVEESVHPYKAPPPDGSGIPLPTAPVGTVCAVRATRPSDGFDPFYAKICVASGVPVVSSNQVDDRALVAAADIVAHMLDPRPDLRNRLMANRLHVGVIGVRENALMMRSEERRVGKECA